MPTNEVGFVPNWRVPSEIKTFVTYRHKGVSKGAYNSFNLGDHVGDDQGRVAENRKILKRELELPCEPTWLNQVHGSHVITGATTDRRPTADAIYTDSPNIICTILTADCLPILLCSQDGREVAAVHAGWRGLLEYVIAATLEKFRVPPRLISAYIGPAISSVRYEVGPELRERFIAADTEYDSAFFENVSLVPGKLNMDLAKIAQIQLTALGLVDIVTSNICTFEKSEHYYSYRRDGISGRFASLIWRSH